MVDREDDVGATLAEIVRCCGALPPAAVCRVGRQLALALVKRHERERIGPHGGLALDRVRVLAGGDLELLDAATPAIRTLAPERRARGGRSVADDLWALGVLLADLALAGAMLDGDRLSEANPSLPPRLHAALDMLVAPANERLTNASAAVCMLTEVEKDFGDGALLMRAALARARGVDVAALTGPPTAQMTPDQVLSVSAIQRITELGAAPTLPDAPRPTAPEAPIEEPRWMLPAIAVAIALVVVIALVWRLF
ncbi:MAG: hypothetical protein A2138_11430 [Deltaproteobacteria bacterium RBG_16_71_12]|nr:MAG: hypothetical protein A2138_11430 [Deltaproteobacteria bacterium RBG_16_71_12]